MPNRIRTVFHQLLMSDVEDPYLYAAAPIYEWQQTEQGQWCMAHGGVDMTFLCHPAYDQWGYTVTIYGDLTEQDHTYFQLRWGFDDSAKRG